MRNDSGVFPGAQVSVHYDPMISKLITWGRDRPEAISRMRRALREFVVKGIKTSIPFHRIVMQNPRVLEGHYDTSFIASEILPAMESGIPSDGEEREVGVMLAAIAAYKRDRERGAGDGSGGPSSSAWKRAGRLAQLRGH